MIRIQEPKVVTDQRLAPAAQHCSVCDQPELERVLDLGDLPGSPHEFFRSQTDATQAATSTVSLNLCSFCGNIAGTRIERRSRSRSRQPEASSRFERRSSLNPRLRAYNEGLASRLVQQLSKTQRGQSDVIELGCDRGDFLASIARRCEANCLGFDPRQAASAHRQLTNLRLVDEDYSPLRFDDCHADLVINRHQLGRAAHPRSLLSDLRSALNASGRFFIEVANAEQQIADADIWSAHADRVTYFQREALLNLLQSSGLDPQQCYAGLGGRTLCISGASRVPTKVEAIEPSQLLQLRQSLNQFASEAYRQIVSWNDALTMRLADGERIAVWGAGSRGVTFLNSVAAGREIAAVVDLNERKHDHYLPGTGQRIIAPEQLRDMAIDTVIIVNADYRCEILAQLRDLGLHCSTVTL